MARTDLLPLNEAQLKQGHPALRIRENVGRAEEDESNNIEDRMVEGQENPRENGEKRTSTTTREDDRQTTTREKDKHSSKKSSKERREKVWLRPGITVRIVSKSLGEKYACPRLHSWQPPRCNMRSLYSSGITVRRSKF